MKIESVDRVIVRDRDIELTEITGDQRLRQTVVVGIGDDLQGQREYLHRPWRALVATGVDRVDCVKRPRRSGKEGIGVGGIGDRRRVKLDAAFVYIEADGASVLILPTQNRRPAVDNQCFQVADGEIGRASCRERV